MFSCRLCPSGSIWVVCYLKNIQHKNEIIHNQKLTKPVFSFGQCSEVNKKNKKVKSETIDNFGFKK